MCVYINTAAWLAHLSLISTYQLDLDVPTQNFMLGSYWPKYDDETRYYPADHLNVLENKQESLSFTLCIMQDKQTLCMSEIKSENNFRTVCLLSSHEDIRDSSHPRSEVDSRM